MHEVGHDRSKNCKFYGIYSRNCIIFCKFRGIYFCDGRIWKVAEGNNYEIIQVRGKSLFNKNVNFFSTKFWVCTYESMFIETIEKIMILFLFFIPYCTVARPKQQQYRKNREKQNWISLKKYLPIS